LVLLVLGGGLLGVNNQSLVPMLSRMSDPASWSGALGFMKGLSDWTEQWGPAAAFSGAALVVASLWSLPRWRGRIRRLADSIMPWSLYKDLQGAVFLMNTGALLGAGVHELEAMQLLHSFAPPWLQERLDAARDEMSEGNSLGMALRKSGYDFKKKTLKVTLAFYWLLQLPFSFSQHLSLMHDTTFLHLFFTLLLLKLLYFVYVLFFPI
ncbi:type II secretion system F family protein, partial [Cellulomonas fimi]|nr:type II secretion system F family protein [Cellulomonas fimi]